MLKNKKNQKVYANIYVKRRVLQLKLDLLLSISRGLLKHQPKKQILMQNKKLVLTSGKEIGLSDGEMNKIYQNSVANYVQISKKTFSTLRKKENHDDKSEQMRKKAIYLSIRASIMQEKQIQEANQIMYSYEYRGKHEYVYGKDGLIDSATSPFFLSSSHPNPAKGHAPYEGKMFYDEDWEEKGDYSEEQKRKIRAYIKNHNLLTIQYIVGEPVYLLTRRNCKHYFKNIPVSEALHSSCRALVKKHNLYMIEKDKSASDALLAYRMYASRLKILEYLSVELDNPVLQKDIVNTKKLVDKYISLL